MTPPRTPKDSVRPHGRGSRAGRSADASSQAQPPVDLEAALATLGLTPLEADVYRFLLIEPASTGYRVAQAIGKPVGNIYKAIEGLEAKGAVATSDDGGNRVAAAVPVAEWVRARRAAFERACDAAGDLLPEPKSTESDELLYTLADRDQVLERAKSMLSAARLFAIATIAPPLIEELAEALHGAGLRLPVAVKCFHPVEIKGVETLLDPRGDAALAGAPGAWLILNVDGQECLFALFSPDGTMLRSASFTRHSLLAWAQYSGLSSDLILAGVRQRLAAGASMAEVEQEIARWGRFETDRSAGKLSLARRYRAAAPRARSER